MLLAGRSTNLMKLAARLLFRGGKPVLAADLAWPSYQRILKREASKANASLTWLKVRSEILRHDISAEKIVNMLIDRFLAKKCGGIFVPEVSHDGIRLPVAEIVQAIRQCDRTAFVSLMVLKRSARCRWISPRFPVTSTWVVATNGWEAIFLWGSAFVPIPRRWPT